MSRPRRLLDVQKQAAQVVETLAKEPPGWRRERLLAVILGLENEQDLQAIAKAMSRARSVIQEWFDLYRAGGLASLLQRRRGQGPQSRLTEKYAVLLEAGLRENRWRTAAQAQRALAAQELHVTLTTIDRYLGKFGARLRVPRPSHLEKDPAAAALFKTTLAEQLTALELDPAKPVRLWVMDEMRCGRHTERAGSGLCQNSDRSSRSSRNTNGNIFTARSRSEVGPPSSGPRLRSIWNATSAFWSNSRHRIPPAHMW